MFCTFTFQAKKKNTCVSGNPTDPTLFSAKVPSQNFFFSFFSTPSPLKKLKKMSISPLNMQCLKNSLHALLKFSFSQCVRRVNNQVSCTLPTISSIESLFPSNILASCCNEHGNCCKAVRKGQSQGHFYCSCLSLLLVVSI